MLFFFLVHLSTNSTVYWVYPLVLKKHKWKCLLRDSILNPFTFLLCSTLSVKYSWSQKSVIGNVYCNLSSSVFLLESFRVFMAFRKCEVISLLDVCCLFLPPNLSTMDSNCFLYLLLWRKYTAKCLLHVLFLPNQNVWVWILTPLILFYWLLMNLHQMCHERNIPELLPMRYTLNIFVGGGAEWKGRENCG